MDTTLVLAVAGFVISLAGPVLVALSRLSWSQVELRMSTAERRVEELTVRLAASELRVAVVSSQHDGTTYTLREIKEQLAVISAHILGRSSTHES